MAWIFPVLGRCRGSGSDRVTKGFDRAGDGFHDRFPDADAVAAARSLKLARALYLSGRVPEWLYKIALKLTPSRWYPEPQAYLLKAQIEDHAIQIIHRTDDTIGREAWLFGYYDRLVLGFLRELVQRLKRARKDPMVFYDIGANIGNHTVFLADLFDSIYCFEPNSKALKKLEINVSPFPQVQIFPIGLSNQDTELGFMTGSATNLGNAHIVAPEDARASMAKITVRNGDRFIRDENLVPPVLMKIDVEGHEADAIEGLEATIAEHTPVIVLEVLARALDKVSPVREMLRACGYRTFKTSGLGRARQLTSFRNEIVLTPFDLDESCENAIAIPPCYWNALKDLAT